MDDRGKIGPQDTDIFDSVERWVEKVLKDSGKFNKLDAAKTTLRQTLLTTGHLPTIHSVARGAGYCYYYARLCETVGAKASRYSRDRLSGKGSDIHKITGLAVLKIFKEGGFRSLPQELLRRAVEDSFNKLANEGHLSNMNINDRNKVVDLSSKLLINLFSALRDICSKLGVNVENLRPVVEQLFLDYRLHMRGSPDLILEDIGERKAIVVEWKTTGITPSPYEIAQVLAYSLMAARRLGYGRGQGMEPREELKHVILGELRGNRVEGFKILPLIVRPISRGEIYPHPALAPPSKVEDRYRVLERQLSDVLLEAEHLTVLLTNQEKLTGDPPNMLLVPLPGRPDIEVNVLRYKPKQLKSGNPKDQSRWPCVSKYGKYICELRSACKFYYARNIGEREDYERILWGLRYSVFDDKEKNLLAYKALYHIFDEDELGKDGVINSLKRGGGAKLVLGDVLPRVRIAQAYYEIAQAYRRFLPMRILVSRPVYEHDNRKQEELRYRVDVLDELRVERGVLLGMRNLREFERSEESKEPSPIYIVDEGSTVFLTPLDSWNPLLSINLFGRIDEVEIENDDRVVYTIGIPSKLLNYQKLLFSEYLDIYGEHWKYFLMVEVDADLTHMELEALDKLQRALEEKLSQQDSDEIRCEIEWELQVTKKLRNLLYGSDPDVRGLKELLKRLIGGHMRRDSIA